MKTYGILLIGCGHIGLEHLSDIYYRDNIRIVAVTDLDQELARKTARRFGALSWGTDYREFLGDSSVDIVIIATYTGTHLPILQDCLAAHKHVLCEKPMATTLEAGREFVKLVKHSPEKVLVAHILRHNKTYARIRELIRGGAIGELRLIRMSQNHHAMNWPRYVRLLEDCSPTLDCGVHYYDLVRWISGSPISRVQGFGVRTQADSPRDNYTMVSFRTESGCAGYYEAGWGQSIRSGNLKEFIGTRGRITLQMQATREQEHEEGDCITVYHSDTGVYETENILGSYKNMYAQLSALIRMIETDWEGNPSIDEVWESFCTAQAAEQSIATGLPVTVDLTL